MQITSVVPLWKDAKHNAFTDLCAYNNTLICAFRSAENHVSPDGIIRVLRLTMQGQHLGSMVVRLPGHDLRDPKLSVMPDGKLLMIAYARQFHPDGRVALSQPVSWFSTDGISWSAVKRLGAPFWWLWRVRWCAGRAYGFAYNRSQNALDLWAGDPRRTFECVAQQALSLHKHGKGYPNESDIAFDESGTAYAVVRRDADTATAMLGMAKFPYVQWRWQDLGEHIGAPVMDWLDNNQLLIVGRQWQQQGPVTRLWTLDTRSKSLRPSVTLPSAGDTSYAGMVRHEKGYWISYYSSHEQDHSCIYLADIRCSRTD
ncbi:hypothetical protein LJ739_02405 [Aestuariibacter halophilus]|uniref:Uncharacterized protein n=1 Tax=Fluctibacter halophilus TaxID=226011 RepID=A0ABS8G3R2_9ALTE|nr:hypothetical protein [Aestuariibacter halophilus]MCC2615093.1 hypothetical protein [Aestuariibacter halophilus]